MMKVQINDKIREELEKIRSKDAKGMLRPEAVVEASKKKSSPLYKLFMWDEDPNKVAYYARLQLAQQLIVRVKVTVEAEEEKTYKVRAYVSLPSDRVGGQGYRRVEDVMSDNDMRKELLQAARRDLELFTTRYRALKDIAEFWDAFASAQTVLNEAEV